MECTTEQLRTCPARPIVRPVEGLDSGCERPFCPRKIAQLEVSDSKGRVRLTDLVLGAEFSLGGKSLLTLRQRLCRFGP